MYYVYYHQAVEAALVYHYTNKHARQFLGFPALSLKATYTELASNKNIQLYKSIRTLKMVMLNARVRRETG